MLCDIVKKNSAIKIKIKLPCHENLKAKCQICGIMAILFIFLIFNFYPAGSEFLSSASTKPDCPVVTEDDLLDFFDQNGTRSHWSRPVKDYSRPIAITFVLYFWGIVQVDEKNQELSFMASIYLGWQDELRVWNETFPLNCIKYVVLPIGETTRIWTPNLFFLHT